MATVESPVRQSVSLPARIAKRVVALAKTKRTSASRVLVDLIETGLQAKEAQHQRFFELSDRLWSESVPPRHRLAVLARYTLARLPRTLFDQGVLTAKVLWTGVAYTLGVMQGLHYHSERGVPLVPITSERPQPGGPEVYR